ncbi:hypothetical protein P872_07055 [Rhodonellum psychrophilum GCM71 = DSM 17998]|uniref:Gliding motility protein n=2 Tax=Rhodonellum TaxID=336827 RepID=U5BWH1_9BACT|nr:hypothetical protein P872_07055 [Rhodonellum psychrophilum GCM71 = DSM 17998]
MHAKSSLVILCFALLLSACSSEKNTFPNRLYHNTTAKYNAFFLAKEKIIELENLFQSQHQEDYSQILPIFYPVDSATIEQNEALLKEARELASKAIDWHRISKWVDDSYFLIGLIDYYQANFDDAINTFKYINVNSKDKDLRHRSLIQLLRIFTDLKKNEDAAFVIDYLSKESKINPDNKFLLFKTLAYYYDTRGEINGKIGALDKSLEFVKDKKDKSRINFILAQLYKREDLDALAFSYYGEAEKGNPPYERSFFAKLYAQQVAELNKSKDLQRVRNYYSSLYDDSKNRDLRDVILYERALFELKQNGEEEAERLLTLAAKEEGKNQIQKGYIYEKLADIRFDLKKDYRAAKYYLDSALVYFKPSDPSHSPITKRKEVLDDYVIHFETIIRNDSLIALSLLTPEEQELIADAFIKGEEERLLREAAKKEEPKSSGIFENLLAFSGRGSGENFYFDNAVALQQGSIDFFRNWGNRTLQDNWRRSGQGFQSAISEPEQNIEIKPSPSDSIQVEDEKPLLGQLPDKESLMAQIPKTEESLKVLREALDISYFELGKLLFLDLKEPDPGIGYLENHIEKYPNSVKKPESYYLLYLAQTEINGDARRYVERLNKEFPESPFTFSVNNPEGATGNLAYLESSKKYEEAYSKYYSRQYQEARSIIRSTLEAYPLTRNTEKFMLLDIMVSGKIDDRERYQSRLENYIQNTEDTGLLNMARNMLIALTGEKPKTEQKNEGLEAVARISEEGDDRKSESDSEEAEEVTPYKENPNQTHIFVIVLEPKQAAEAKGLLADLENFHSQNFSNARLRTGNMNLNSENAIFIVSPFNNAERALAYREKFMQDFNTSSLNSSDKDNSFLISIENFQELNKRKDINEYRNFYKKTYQ